MPSDLAVDVEAATRVDSEKGRLIFVHGSMDTGRSFRRLREQFPDWQTLTYDRRGYGASVGASVGLGPIGVEHHVQDLTSLARQRPCVLFGHSLGGVLSLIVASRLSESVRGNVIYEAPLPWLDWWPPASLPADPEDAQEVDHAAEGFLRRAIGDDKWRTLPEAKRAEMLGWGPAWASELVELTNGDWPFEPSAIRQPVLVLRGDQATERQVRGSTELSTVLPHARNNVIPQASHVAHARRAAAVAEPVYGFLDHVRLD